MCILLDLFFVTSQSRFPRLRPGAQTCAVKANGEVVCFGYNRYGQCNVPPDLDSAVSVAVGYPS